MIFEPRVYLAFFHEKSKIKTKSMTEREKKRVNSTNSFMSIEFGDILKQKKKKIDRNQFGKVIWLYFFFFCVCAAAQGVAPNIESKMLRVLNHFIIIMKWRIIESSHRQRTPIKWCFVGVACARFARRTRIRPLFLFRFITFRLWIRFYFFRWPFFFFIVCISFFLATHIFEKRQRYRDRDSDIYVLRDIIRFYSVQIFATC